MTMQLHSILSSTYRHLTPLTVIKPILYLNYDLDRRREPAGEQWWRLRWGTRHPQHLRHVLDQRLQWRRRTGGLPLGSRGRGIQYLIEIAIK